MQSKVTATELCGSNDPARNKKIGRGLYNWRNSGCHKPKPTALNTMSSIVPRVRNVVAGRIAEDVDALSGALEAFAGCTCVDECKHLEAFEKALGRVVSHTTKLFERSVETAVQQAVMQRAAQKAKADFQKSRAGAKAAAGSEAASGAGAKAAKKPAAKKPAAAAAAGAGKPASKKRRVEEEDADDGCVSV